MVFLLKNLNKEQVFFVPEPGNAIYRAADVDSGWVEMEAKYPRKIFSLTAVLILTENLNCTINQ